MGQDGFPADAASAHVDLALRLFTLEGRPDRWQLGGRDSNHSSPSPP